MSRNLTKAEEEAYRALARAARRLQRIQQRVAAARANPRPPRGEMARAS